MHSLYPLLFLLVAEGLSRAILNAKRIGNFVGLKISNSLKITHLLFVDDILLFYYESERDVGKLVEILKLFEKVAGMW